MWELNIFCCTNTISFVGVYVSGFFFLENATAWKFSSPLITENLHGSCGISVWVVGREREIGFGQRAKE